MKLLSRSEAQAKKSVETAKTASLKQELENKVNKLKAELNQLNDEFNSKKVEVSNEYVEFCQQTAEKKKELVKDVELLEERRIELLKPVDEILERAKSIELLNISNQKALDEQKNQLDEQEKTLSSEIEIVDELRDELLDKKEELEVRSNGVKSQELFIRKSQEELNKKWSEYHLEVSQKMKELSDRDERLQADRASLETLKNENIKDKELINQDRIKLASQREVLQRAWDELRKKQTL